MDEHYRLKAEERDWYSDRNGSSPDELSDIFSLGAVFYQMLTSMPPDFKEGRLVKSQHFVRQPIEVQRLVERMLSFDRIRRPQSVEAVTSELLPLVDESKTAIRKEDARTHVREVEKQVIRIQRFNGLTFVFMLLALASICLNVLLLSDMEEVTRGRLIVLWQQLHSFLR
jgi:serine/threonine-protein kinase